MKNALFECLTGRFNDGTLLESINAEYRKSFSIMNHISRLFNTRKGSISHLPGYGLPDISEIYRKMPDGIDELQYAIREVLEMFEPRLQNVDIVYIGDNPNLSRLVFIITGEIKHGCRIRFQTAFNDSGEAGVSLLKTNHTGD